ncbi:class I SAM-dependent methyltransferase [Spirosoma sordidisoli]|uniref:Class I SAM-dependent methyltransferase n=1 Tax=Spirosoma sordidisoli TaxID=2502893 RepID=A0A4Q2UN01_9BACT|nr:class I SAM-dependent methyltransferase [Spirosoma sordidisoli]RYC71037.1 class I SAM-dependent methyltransferase [Spirosoma sordidisoli]
MNPWSDVPADDYERHMSHDTVGQLACLSEITQEKIEQRYPQTIAVYGACTGNGFVHFTDARRVYAVDLNPTYLAICHERYDPILNELVLIQADINQDPVPIPPDSAELIICHLFLEYVDLERAFASIRQTLRRGGLLNVVLQRSNNSGWVSNTGVTTLQPVAAIATEVAEESLLAHTAPTLRFEGRQTYRMPNGKSLISYDFIKQ